MQKCYKRLQQSRQYFWNLQLKCRKKDVTRDGVCFQVPGVVHDGVESVSDGENGAVLELCADGGLDEIVRLQIDSSRGFIQDQDPGLPQ